MLFAELGVTPFAVIDIEATGIYAGSNDRIIEIACSQRSSGSRSTDRAGSPKRSTTVGACWHSRAATVSGVLAAKALTMPRDSASSPRFSCRARR